MLNKKPTDWINSENLYMWGVYENKKGKLFSNKRKAKKILIKQGFYD